MLSQVSIQASTVQVAQATGPAAAPSEAPATGFLALLEGLATAGPAPAKSTSNPPLAEAADGKGPVTAGVPETTVATDATLAALPSPQPAAAPLMIATDPVADPEAGERPVAEDDEKGESVKKAEPTISPEAIPPETLSAALVALDAALASGETATNGVTQGLLDALRGVPGIASLHALSAGIAGPKAANTSVPVNPATGVEAGHRPVPQTLTKLSAAISAALDAAAPGAEISLKDLRPATRRDVPATSVEPSTSPNPPSSTLVGPASLAPAVPADAALARPVESVPAHPANPVTAQTEPKPAPVADPNVAKVAVAEAAKLAAPAPAALSVQPAAAAEHANTLEVAPSLTAVARPAIAVEAPVKPGAVAFRSEAPALPGAIASKSEATASVQPAPALPEVSVGLKAATVLTSASPSAPELAATPAPQPSPTSPGAPGNSAQPATVAPPANKPAAAPNAVSAASPRVLDAEPPLRDPATLSSSPAGEAKPVAGAPPTAISTRTESATPAAPVAPLGSGASVAAALAGGTQSGAIAETAPVPELQAHVAQTAKSPVALNAPEQNPGTAKATAAGEAAVPMAKPEMPANDPAPQSRPNSGQQRAEPATPPPAVANASPNPVAPPATAAAPLSLAVEAKSSPARTPAPVPTDAPRPEAPIGAEALKPGGRPSGPDLPPAASVAAMPALAAPIAAPATATGKPVEVAATAPAARNIGKPEARAESKTLAETAAKPEVSAPLTGDPEALPASETLSSQQPGTALLRSDGTALSKAAQAAYQTPAQALPGQVNLPHLAFEIAHRVHLGSSRFQVRLDPAELGRVDVRMEIDSQGGVNARLTVERPETLDLLQRDSRALERALAQAGLDGAKTNLEFSLRQQSFTAPDQQDGRNARTPHDQPANGSADDSTQPLSVTPYRGTATPGGVNIFA